MSIFDTILLIIMLAFIANGLIKGFIRSIGSVVGVVAGVWAAVYVHSWLFLLLKNLFFGNALLGKAACFLIVYVIVNRLVNFGFNFLDNSFDVISFIPFLRTINRVAGALFGFIEGGLILGLLLKAQSYFPATDALFKTWTNNSEVAPFLITFANIFLPLLPGVIEKIQDFIGKFDMEKVYSGVVEKVKK